MPPLRTLLQYGAPIGASVAGGLLNRRAAGTATRRLTDSATQAGETIMAGTGAAMDTLAGTRDRSRETTRPYREAGTEALNVLRTGLQPGGEFRQPFERATDYVVPGYEELQKDPAYQFRLNEGLKALKAQGNAGGTRFSGGTTKALIDYAGQSASQEYERIVNRDRGIFGENYGRAEEQFRENQGDVYDRTADMADRGERATEADVTAENAYGANISNMQRALSEQIANLEMEAANAQAAGDVARANSITDMISGVIGSVEQVGTARALETLLGGGAAAGTAAAVGSAAPALVSAVPGISGLPASFGATIPAAGAAPGGGVAAAITGLLTNPITIAAGAALGIGLLVRKAQAHHKADDWVQGFQNPFDAKMARIDQMVQSRMMSPEDAQAAKAANVKDYLAAAEQFERKGNDHATVIRQARDTFRQQYGDPRQYAAMPDILNRGNV